MDTPTPLPVGADLFRAARAMLGRTPEDLATAAGVDPADLLRLEGDADVPPEVSRAVRQALEQAGIRFMSDGLYRIPASTANSADERMARTRALAERYRSLPVLDTRSEWEILDSLYGEDGLPA